MNRPHLHDDVADVLLTRTDSLRAGAWRTDRGLLGGN